MLQTTQAIILGLRPLNDRASMLLTYTRANGRVNYILYGAHSRHKSTALLAPLSLVELTYRLKSEGSMPILESSRLTYVPHSIPCDVRRQTIALFISEVLLSTLTHPLQDEALFDMLQLTVVELDQSTTPENIHLLFLLRLADALGFAIDAELHPDWFQLPATRLDRQNQLRQLCGYFATMIDQWQPPKSLDILTEVFD